MKPGKHNQFHFTGPQNIDHRLIKGLSARKPLVIQNLDGNPVFFCAHEAVGIGAIAEHDLDLGIQFLRFNGIDDGLKISTTAGNQYADGKLSSHGLPLANKSNLSASFLNFANQEISLTHFLKHGCNAVHMLLADNQDHTEAVIECPVHLIL